MLSEPTRSTYGASTGRLDSKRPSLPETASTTPTAPNTNVHSQLIRALGLVPDRKQKHSPSPNQGLGPNCLFPSFRRLDFRAESGIIHLIILPGLQLCKHFEPVPLTQILYINSLKFTLRARPFNKPIFQTPGPSIINSRSLEDGN